MLVTLAFVNLPLTSLFVSMVLRIAGRYFEYAADCYSYEIAPEYDVRSGLFHMTLCNKAPVYTPFPFVFMFSTHPSVHARILRIEDKRPAPPQ